MKVHFLNPELAVWLLGVAAAVGAWLVHVAYRTRFRHHGGATGAFALSRRSGLRRDLAVLFWAVTSMALLVAAVTRPQVLRERRTPEYERQDLVVIMDRSVSMRARDIQPSRTERALTELKNFLRDRPEAIDRVALVGFADTSLVLSYLTRDIDSLLFYLEWIRDDPSIFYGTDIGAALTTGLEVVARDKTPSRKLFLVISDGEDQGTSLQTSVARVAGQGIRIHTIGIGTAAEASIPISAPGERETYLIDDDGRQITTQFNEATLKMLAAASGGRYVRSITGGELETALHAVARADRRQTGWQTTTEYRDIYGFLLAAAGVAAVALVAIL